MPEKVYSNIDITLNEEVLEDIRISVFNQYKNNYLPDGKTFTFLPYEFYDLIAQVLDLDTDAQKTEKTVKEVYDIFDNNFFKSILSNLEFILNKEEFAYAEGIGITKVLKYGLDVEKTLTIEQKVKQVDIQNRVIPILADLNDLINQIQNNSTPEPKKPKSEFEIKKLTVLKLKIATAKLNAMVDNIKKTVNPQDDYIKQEYKNFTDASSIFLEQIGKYYKIDASKIIETKDPKPGDAFILQEPLLDFLPPLKELLPIYKKLRDVREGLKASIQEFINKIPNEPIFKEAKKALGFDLSDNTGYNGIKARTTIIEDALKEQEEYPKLLEEYLNFIKNKNELLPILISKRDFIQQNFTILSFLNYKQEEKFSLDYYIFPPSFDILLQQNKKVYSYKSNKIKVLSQFDKPKTIPYISIEDPKQNIPGLNGYTRSTQQNYLDTIIQPKKIYIYRTTEEITDLTKDLYADQYLYKILDLEKNQVSYYEDLEPNIDYYYYYFAQIEEPDNSQLSIIQDRYINGMYPADNNRFYYVMGSYINKIRLVKDEEFYFITRSVLTQQDLIKKEYGRKFREKMFIKPTEEIFALVSSTGFDVNYPYLKIRLTSKKTRKKVDFNLRYGAIKTTKFISFEDKKKYDLVPLENFTGKIKTLITPLKFVKPEELIEITEAIVEQTTEFSLTGEQPQTIVQIVQEETAIGQNLEQIQAGDAGIIGQAQQTISNIAIGGTPVVPVKPKTFDELIATKDLDGLTKFYINQGIPEAEAKLLAQLSLSPNVNELFTL